MKATKSSAVHVCFVLEGHALANMGGAEYQAHQLAEELSQREDVRVTYLARTLPKAWDGSYEIRQIGDASGFRRRAVLFDGPMLWKVLNDLRPDVIYQRMKQSYTAVCAYYARRVGVPLIFHVASDPDADGRWLRRQLSLNAPLDLLEVAAGNWGVRHASHVVVQTLRQGELLQQRFGREASAVMGNFQPLPDVLPQKQAAGLRILWVGNIKEVKRPDLFLELAERIRPQPGVEFWMVGRAGSHRGIARTMEAIRSSKRVKYFGELSLNDVNCLMNEADVFVNTSSFEGFPNTFIQAWARGTVVTSLNVDTDEGMESHGIGYCTGDLTRLANVIEELNASPQLRSEIAQRAFVHVRKKHALKNRDALVQFVLDAATSNDKGRLINARIA